MYAFSTHVADPVGDIINRSAGVLQCTPEAVRYGASGATADSVVARHECSGHIVRDVAPKKVMVCLSFTLPEEVNYNFCCPCACFCFGTIERLCSYLLHHVCTQVARAQPLDFASDVSAQKGTKRDSETAGLE